MRKSWLEYHKRRRCPIPSTRAPSCKVERQPSEEAALTVHVHNHASLSATVWCICMAHLQGAWYVSFMLHPSSLLCYLLISHADEVHELPRKDIR